MKRLYSVLLAVMLLIGLCACGADTTSADSESKPETQPTQPTQPPQPSTAPTEPVPAGLQVLHVLLPGFRVLPEKVLLPAF